MIILLDNGHGNNTGGKRSPDSSLLEWKYTREVARDVRDRLCSMRYDARLIVTEEYDVSLWERARRVNELCDQYGKDNVILVSIHCNAAGNGSSWMNANGWECYTTRGETKADKLATALYDSAKIHLPNVRLRVDYTDGDPDKEASFYILKHTKCPAVLTENLFMDNKNEVAFLLSDTGRDAIARLHTYGIVKFIRDNQ